jgi:molecular chaperone DnaK (HSP70)
MKLFQIEEPDGAPANPGAPGIAIGIDIGGEAAAVAVAVGGNAAVLADRDGFALNLAVPTPDAGTAEWQRLLEGARLRAERALAQPATHAVLAVAAPPDRNFAERLYVAGAAAGLTVLRILAPADMAAGAAPAAAAATLAEDLAPRPPAA